MTHNDLDLQKFLDECRRSGIYTSLVAMALRSVIELHSPRMSYLFSDLVCDECSDEEEFEIVYPCKTIKAIKEYIA